ncbi:MAG: S8 family serine peptidase [Cyanobacteria bacterium]|jgi:subtilisin family serine protease|nr:S8 family serine peptidase [Cyanobacteria bacterium GSL.Bin21]
MLNRLIDQQQFNHYPSDTSTENKGYFSRHGSDSLEISSDPDETTVRPNTVLSDDFDWTGNGSSFSQPNFFPISPTVVDDYADNVNTTGQITVGATEFGNLERIGDRDWFAINLEAGATYEFSLNGDSLTDPYLRLYDEAGNFIAYDDDTIDSLDATLSFTATSSNTFYLSAGSFADVYTGSYQLSAELVSPPPGTVSEPGETLNAAFDLGTLGSDETLQTSNRVGLADPLDIYRFTLDASLSLEVRLSNLSSDIDLVLLDNQGDLINFSRNGQTQNEFITETLDTGDYYLAVYPYSGSSYFNLELSANSPPELPAGYSARMGYGETQVDQALGELLNLEVPTVEPLGGENWGLDRMGAPAAWEMGYTGEETIVAVLDTGIDLNHPDLDDNIWVNQDEVPGNGFDDDNNGYIDDVQGWDFANNDNNPDDVNSHGTHVAGTIAAEDNNLGITGVAPDAQIMPVQVLGDNGAGYNSDIIAGINYAVDNGADIINLSLGGSSISPGINAAIQEATDLGTLVVMAAGNSAGSSPENPGAYAAEAGLVVGALTQEGDLGSFSNQAGDTPQDYNGDGLAFPSYVTAPGVDILSTIPDGNYEFYSGTSMATPHVAGAAAILMGADPGLTPDQTVDLITATANSNPTELNPLA